MNLMDKVLALFVNNLALSEGVQLIGMFEGKGSGITFSNWTEGLSVDDNFSFIMVIIVMIVNNFIHVLLLFYFEQVLPGDHGIAKPWNFPVQFLFGKSKKSQMETNVGLVNGVSISKDTNTIRNTRNGDTNLPVHIEDESIHASKPVGIKISNITKIFKQLGTFKKAVNNLSLNIYEGQISVLLGHNGAGKSTTISMITGLNSPETGEILINNVNIVEDTIEARKNLGYCPQHNLLFDNLTVYEHLKFFSTLKENFDDAEIDYMLEMLNLKDKKFSLSKSLSGGMKRKLSVAIAFIGGSKIVILDEPSSGMDPQARHTTWTLLQKFKKEKKCTILLTTHFMDEADVLGDRIAIMSKGSLRACGSPLFLKSKYGNGYNLVLTKKRKENGEVETESSNIESSDKIINAITSIIPTARLSSNINTEISFVLPTDETGKFSSLFESLEKQKENLDILNIGISVTTLEEVFLRIGDDENSDETEANLSFTNPLYATTSNGETHHHNESTSSASKSDDDEFKTYGLWVGQKNSDLVFGVRLIFQQFMILFKKRYIHSIRNKVLIISQIVIPISVLLINLFYLKYAPIKAGDSPSLTIDINKYSKNYIPYRLISDEPIANAPIINSLKDFYVSQFNGPNLIPFNLNDNKTNQLCSNNRDTIDNFLACIGDLSINYIVDNYLVGTDFNLTKDKVSMITHFNNQPYHIPPMALNVMSNTLFKYFTNSTANKITVINHPLPRNLKEKVTDLQLKDATGFNIGTGLTFGFSFLIASFVIFIIKEKASDSKHLQYMSGCNSYAYWISALIWDMLNYIIAVFFTLFFLKVKIVLKKCLFKFF
jgi:ATP-binding cassette subfamily A (ABC1) protein 3